MKLNSTETDCLHQINISETLFVSIRPTFGDLLRFRETINWILAAFPSDQFSETCCLSVTPTIFAAFPSDRLSEICCLSVRPSVGYLLRFRETSFLRLSAFLSDQLFETFCVSVRPALGVLLRFYQIRFAETYFVSVFPPLPLLSRSDHVHEVCSVPIRSEFRRLALSLSAASRRLALSDGDRLSVEALIFSAIVTRLTGRIYF